MNSLFQKLEGWLYFDNAASTPPFIESTRSATDFLLTYGSIHRGEGYMSDVSSEHFEMSRLNILNKLNVSNTHDLIFTANTTDGINKFSLMFDLRGKKVLIPFYEHSSNILPWYQRGADILFIKSETPFKKIDIEELEKVFKTQDIFAFTFALATNISGVVYGLEEQKAIYELGKKYNVLIFHDASQYVAHYKYDASYSDGAAFAGHKMYAPFGVGGLVIRKGLTSNHFNSIEGGGNIDLIAYDDIKNISDNIVTANLKLFHKKGAHQHETGTPNGIGAVALSKAFDILYSLDFEAHTRQLCDFINKECKDITILDDVATPIILVSDIPRISTTLRDNMVAFRRGQFCAYSFLNEIKLPSAIRLSAGLINSIEDLIKLKSIFHDQI